MKITNRSTVGTLLALPLLVLMLTACSPDAPDAAGGNSENPPSAAGSDQEFMDWQLDFAACMRGEGIDMPDPTSGGAMQAIPMDEAEAFDAASTICIGEIGEPPVMEGQLTEAEMLEEQLELAQCLRKNGIEVDDPKPGQAMGLPSADELTDAIMEDCGLGGIPTGGGQ